jgi:hypothetical protein
VFDKKIFCWRTRNVFVFFSIHLTLFWRWKLWGWFIEGWYGIASGSESSMRVKFAYFIKNGNNWT